MQISLCPKCEKKTFLEPMIHCSGFTSKLKVRFYECNKCSDYFHKDELLTFKNEYEYKLYKLKE